MRSAWFYDIIVIDDTDSNRGIFFYLEEIWLEKASRKKLEDLQNIIKNTVENS